MGHAGALTAESRRARGLGQGGAAKDSGFGCLTEALLALADAEGTLTGIREAETVPCDGRGFSHLDSPHRPASEVFASSPPAKSARTWRSDARGPAGSAEDCFVF